jgi:hypothetical protein
MKLNCVPNKIVFSFLEQNPGNKQFGEAELPKATGDRRQATGDRRQATGDRRQATGDRRQAIIHIF